MAEARPARRRQPERMEKGRVPSPAHALSHSINSATAALLRVRFDEDELDTE